MTVDTSRSDLLQHGTEDDDLVALAHEFAAKELRPVAAEYEESGTYPHEIVRKAASVGLAAYDLPEEYGGGGVTSITVSISA